MSDAAPAQKHGLVELRASAHLMQLDAGVYCVYHTPGSAPPDPVTGLPGARLSLGPGQGSRYVTITGFRDDGWLGSLDEVALIRVAHGPAEVLMTVYQAIDSQHPPPRIQVTKVAEIQPGVDDDYAAPAVTAMPPTQAQPAGNPGGPEVAAHLQGRGDVVGQLGEWMGDPASQRWIEGFALSPLHSGVTREEIEYQAVLGRGWLSPWAEGGQFCGSRGMALPILGLRVRLRGRAAETHTLEISATFTDGTEMGPVGPGDACEAESLAPLEAFCINVVPLATQRAATKRVPSGETSPPVPARRAPPKAKTAADAPAKPPRGRRA